MTEQWMRNAFRNALRSIEGQAPRNLVVRAQPDADDQGETLEAADLTELIASADASDAFLNALGMQVHKWDAAPATDDWVADTVPSTPERRELICTKLGIDDAGAAALLGKRPIYRDETIVITAPWDPWYKAERAREHEFYWPAYRSYLLETKKWPGESVTSLDLATSDVIRRLADPCRPEALQSKGLVVGYVQSGKTANFTGVVAKAIDAGYRLVIVMTGTIELLRSQTQRRMDMEMVGRQNILGDYTEEQAAAAKVDYQFDDNDWLAGRFADHGPDSLDTAIHRLTLHHKDYQKQFLTLKIDRLDPTRPLYDPHNLFRTAARLAIVKKNAAVLKKLVNDIQANKNAFAEIPVLIIDDESDQASVNTVDPEKVRQAKAEGKEIKERRAINEHIAMLLELMPRAQYVGYTATPFANVFTDPSDPLGIFPKDFVIGLSRPPGYMGVDDFHDFDLDDAEIRSPENSNERAFVRHLEADDDDRDLQDEELAEAIDMFVLAGAIKLFRNSVDPSLVFRHHTMLVHQSVKKDDHRELAERVRDLWRRAEFTGPKGKARLRALYQQDVLVVSKARREAGVPDVPSFDELSPFIPKAIGKIAEHKHNPVLVVNSDKDIEQQSLDFDRSDTWRILVGGAKLSRGFTVEGLTVTYFRRATDMTDSLTQMGRWFGFRQGYRDLIRLYIARLATFKSRAVDLYEAFENVARDEAAFRDQLEQYAQWEDGRPRIRPIEIPPLVSQHLPWLNPTARSKMFNAVLEEQSEQPFTPTGYANRLDLLHANLETWRPLLAAAEAKVVLPESPGKGTFDAYAGRIEAAALIDTIEKTQWLPFYRERSVGPKLAFYKRLLESGELDDFLFVLAQPATEKVEIDALGPRSVASRDRRQGRGGKFGEITDRKHRSVIDRFVSGEPVKELAHWHGTKTGAVLGYLVRETKPCYEPTDEPVPPIGSPEHGLVVAFSAYVPTAVLPKQSPVLRFRVIDPANEDIPIVEAPVGE